jgi:hypothetical protein
MAMTVLARVGEYPRPEVVERAFFDAHGAPIQWWTLAYPVDNKVDIATWTDHD